MGWRSPVPSWLLVPPLAMLLLVGTFVWLRLTAPTDGARLQWVTDDNVWATDGVVIASWRDEPGGLRDRDLVVAIDGRSIASWAAALGSPDEWRPLGQVGETLTYTVVRDGRSVEIPVTLRSPSLRSFLARDWSILATGLLFLAIAVFVLRRRPAEPAARALVVCATGMIGDAPYFLGLTLNDLTGGWGFWLGTATSALAWILFAFGLLHFWLVFPRPRAFVQDRRWLVPALYAAPLAVVAVVLLAAGVVSDSALEWIGRADLVTGITALVALIAAVAVAGWSFRRARDPVARRQVRWVAVGVLGVAAGLALWAALPHDLRHQPAVTWVAAPLIGLPIPLAVAVAILRHQLLDIDVVLNRTLVWGALTAFVVGSYVLVVGYLGALLRGASDLTVSLAATGLVAVLFQPLRGLVQRVVDRFVYGDRDDPYAVVARLGRRFEATPAPDAVLPAITETVARALKLPYAAIALRNGDGYALAAAYGTPRGDVLTLPLVYGASTVGQLALAPRTPGEPFGPVDRRLLEDLARQIGVVAHATRLNADLQRSRERMVLAREEERRRLRNELHDGLGPVLSGLTLKLEAVRNRLAHDPVASEALADLAVRTQMTVADVRRMVYALRPPALDELGLVSALRETASFSMALPGELRVTIEAPDHLPPLPAAVEVAAYRIAQEALTNVVRHARARSCTIRLTVREGLLLAVEDDGEGPLPDVKSGVGLDSMRERAEELGGRFVLEPGPGRGTRVTAWLPIDARADGAEHARHDAQGDAP